MILGAVTFIVCVWHRVCQDGTEVILLLPFQDPAARRRAALEESLRWHEFNFEVDAEMQWIKEHMALATSTVSVWECGEGLWQGRRSGTD